MTKVERVDAAGGVLYRASDQGCEVLLIKRRGKWDLPKGKREEGESFEVCAVREVEEETGASPNLKTWLLNTYHEYIENGRTIGKTTQWYAMTPSDPDFHPVPQIEEEIESVVWVPLTEAGKRVAYDNLVTVLDQFEKSVGPRPS